MAVSPTNICPDIPLSEEFYSEEKLTCLLPREPILSSTRAIDYVYKGSLACSKFGVHLSAASENRKVILLDFETPEQMDRTFNRLGAFIDEESKRKVPDTSKMEVFQANGQTYRFSDIIDFYNFCLKEKIEMTREENALLEGFLDKGLLILKEGDQSLRYISTTAQELAVVAVRNSNNVNEEDLNITFQHEFSHALFIVNPYFHALVSKVWRDLDLPTQQFLRGTLMASGIYKSGDQWIIETETQAYSIAPPLNNHGLINVLLMAEENCNQLSSKQPSQACKDFWSFRGNLEGLLIFLHTTYSNATAPYMPLLNSKSLPHELYTKLEEIKFVIDLGNQPQTPEGRIKIELGRLQKQFDRKHKRK